MEKIFVHYNYQLNGKIHLNFLLHVLTIKQVIESVSGYWNTSSG